MPRREMTPVEQMLSDAVYDAIQHGSNSTARTQQSREFRLGMSDIGHCREYARRIVIQEPESDERDATAAFIGTAVGAHIETALAELHPSWQFQTERVFHIPSGGEIAGHPDIVVPPGDPDGFPQGVLDLKTKAELDTVRRYGQSQQQQFQITGYAKACIDDGTLDPDQPIIIGDIFVDRSGVDPHPYVVAHEYDPDVLLAIDSWIEDVKYAVVNGEEAPKDKPREWCWNWCSRATACRGGDTDASGLITDEAALAAVEAWAEGGALESAGKQMKNRAKIALKNTSGSTGTHTVRWVEVGATEVPGFTRDAYMKLDIRRIRNT